MVGSYITGAIVYLAGPLRICNLGSELLIVIIKVLVVIFFIVTICLDYSWAYSRLLIVILNVAVWVLCTISANRLAHVFIALWDQRITSWRKPALGCMLGAGLSLVRLGDVWMLVGHVDKNRLVLNVVWLHQAHLSLLMRSYSCKRASGMRIGVCFITWVIASNLVVVVRLLSLSAAILARFLLFFKLGSDCIDSELTGLLWVNPFKILLLFKRLNWWVSQRCWLISALRGFDFSILNWALTSWEILKTHDALFDGAWSSLILRVSRAIAFVRFYFLALISVVFGNDLFWLGSRLCVRMLASFLFVSCRRRNSFLDLQGRHYLLHDFRHRSLRSCRCKFLSLKFHNLRCSLLFFCWRRSWDWFFFGSYSRWWI